MQDRRASFLSTVELAHVRCAISSRLRTGAEEWIQGLLSLLFPQLRFGKSATARNLLAEARELDLQLLQLFADARVPLVRSDQLIDELWQALPKTREDLLQDAAAIDAFDPASESLDEVVLAYPGFYATAVHRVAHILHGMDIPLIPRLIAEYAHRQTGIDIHPGATIGVPLVIDHGTGIVIGETAVIGQRVKLYHGVTIGALAVKKGLAKKKRHPTIEDDVIIYSGATILGGETVVGSKSVIGGNAWLIHSVPPGSVITDEVRTVVSSRRHES